MLCEVSLTLSVPISFLFSKAAAESHQKCFQAEVRKGCKEVMKPYVLFVSAGRWRQMCLDGMVRNQEAEATPASLEGSSLC